MWSETAWGDGDTVLTKTYQGNDGYFTTGSDVIKFKERKPELQYELCNLEKNKQFYYYWTGANFGSGIDPPIPVGNCALLSRVVDEYQEENTNVLFSLHNTSTPVEAYIPNEKKYSFSYFYTQIIAPYLDNDTPSIVEANISVVASDKGARYSLTWSPAVAKIAIGF